MIGPPVDVLLKGAALVLDHPLHAQGGHAALRQTESFVDVLTERFLVLLGDAQEHADGAHRHRGADVADEVEAAGFHQRIEAAGAELAHLGLELLHAAGCEGARQQAAMEVVVRRVLEDDRAGRHLEGALGNLLDELHDGALAGDVRRPIHGTRLHVRKAAQGVEVVAVVVIEGSLVAQPLPDRIRVRIDLEVVRVVVDVGAQNAVTLT